MDTAHPLQKHFLYCPQCGAHPIDKRGGNGVQCSACGFVYYLNPAVAVAGIAMDAAGRVVFIRRAKDPGRGMLAMPGGFIDVWETAEHAVERELHEEIKLRIANLRYVTSAPNSYHYKGITYPVLDLFYAADVVGIEGTPDADEVAGVEWHTVDSVDAEVLAFPSMRTAWAIFKAQQQVSLQPPAFPT